MRLFLVSNMYPDAKSPGYGVFVKNVADYLDDNGINISHLAVIKGRSKNVIHKIVKYVIFYVEIMLYYFKDYDVMYIHYPNMAIPVLFPLFKICNKRLIVNYHGEDLLYSGRVTTILGRLTEKFVKRYADIVVVPSNFFKQELLKRLICTEDKILVFPSGGINPKVFYPSVKTNNYEGIQLGFVGRIEYGKGWKEYLLALDKLKDNIDFRGYIIGYGTLEPEMYELISQCGLTDKIEVIRGIPQDKLRHYYTLFDLLLFTTQLPESLGLVGLEAMACGTPIIATNIGGLATYAVNNYNSLCVEKGDIIGIATSIVKYNNMSREERNTMCNNCVNTAKKYYTDTIFNTFLRNIKRHLNVVD